MGGNPQARIHNRRQPSKENGGRRGNNISAVAQRGNAWTRKPQVSNCSPLLETHVPTWTTAWTAATSISVFKENLKDGKWFVLNYYSESAIDQRTGRESSVILKGQYHSCPKTLIMECFNIMPLPQCWGTSKAVLDSVKLQKWLV